MTVKELIEKLQLLPQDLETGVEDENEELFLIEAVMLYPTIVILEIRGADSK